MKYFDQVFHLLAGGLEFLEISAKVSDTFDIVKIKQCVKKFGTINNINVLVVDTLPKIVIGKDIYMKYNKEQGTIIVKALHCYYDGVAITTFFGEVDRLYCGQELKTKFVYKTPIKNVYINKCVELGANVIMNKVGEEYDDTKLAAPYAVYDNISSGNLIRTIQETEKKDMIMLISNSKLENNTNQEPAQSKVSVMKTDLTFRYVKYGEDFKQVLKHSSVLEQGIRFAAWLAKKKTVIFFNNLSSMKLPSFIDKLVCHTEAETKSPNARLITLVAYPRDKSGIVEIYKT